MKLFLFALVACTSIACGEVRIPNNDGGGAAGATGGDGAGGSGGQGGSGGTPADGCEPGELRLVGDPAVVELGEMYEQTHPRLVALSDTDVILAVTARMTTGEYARSPARIVIAPWTSWPPEVPAPVPLAIGSADETAAGTSADGPFLVSTAPEGTHLVTSLVVNADVTSFGSGPLVSPQFAVSAEGSYLVRTQGWDEEIVTRLLPSGVTEVLEVPCVGSAQADAVAVADGFLVAERFAIAVDGDCGKATGEANVTKYQLSPQGELVRSVRQTFAVSPYVSNIGLAPRAGGAWLLVEDGTTAFAQKLDTEGQNVGDSVAIEATEPRRGLAHFGAGFATAAFEGNGADGAPEDTTVTVAVYDEAGALRAGANLVSPYSVGSGLNTASLLASPDGSSLLVAFSGRGPSSRSRAP